MPFMIKQHDRRPYLTGTVLKPDATPMDLSLVTDGFIVMRETGTTGAPLFRKEVTFPNPTLGKFQYAWDAGDTDDVGTFDVELELMWGTEPQTVPVAGYYTVIVVDDLDNP